MRPPLRFLLLLVLALGACDLTDPYVATDSTPLTGGVTLDDERAYHPIVLSQADGASGLSVLNNTRVGDIVAFAYDASAGAFAQIPVQVDERYVYDAARVYQGVTSCAGNWCTNVTGHVVTLGYADRNAAAGPDPSNKFDSDDEVALMLSDFGDPAQGHPNGVDARTAVEVKVTLDGADSYAYLYKRRGNALQPSAGRDYVAYRFDTVNPTYDVVGVAPQDFTGQLTPTNHGVSNPERTSVDAEGYRMEFADRWVMDHLAIGPPDARTPDLLTVNMMRGTDNPTRPDFDGCVRWPFTGSASEGGFLVNVDGPIRAIRRFIGFNSGPLTEMTWVFYPYSVETVTTPRVHRLNHGLAQFFHLSAAAEGYTYAYGTGTGPPATDVVDEGDPGFGSVDLPAWQTLTGPDGAGWALLYGLETDIPFHLPDEQPRLFYEDDGGLMENCDIDDVTGSTYRTALTSYRGAHGVEVPFQTSWGAGSQNPEGGLPNTDPRHESQTNALYHISFTRRIAFGPDPAAALTAMQVTPTVTTRRYNP
jgi:hypothetical protein